MKVSPWVSVNWGRLRIGAVSICPRLQVSAPEGLHKNNVGSGLTTITNASKDTAFERREECKNDFSFCALVALALVASLATYAAAHPPVISAVEFGHPGVGSAQAEDALSPRTTVVAAGATVYFGVTSRVHGVAIYDSGTRPGDIDTSILIPGAGNCPTPSSPRYINDTENRLAIFNPPCSTNTQTGTVSYTFNQPGRYLVICTFNAHYIDHDMYGWVVVKD